MSEEMKSGLVMAVFKVTPLGKLSSIEGKATLGEVMTGGLMATKLPLDFSLSFFNQ